MNVQPVIRDERTDAVVGTCGRLVYFMLSIGLMIIVAVRTWAFRQACWDLLGLYFVTSVVGLVYLRVNHVQVLPRRGLIWLALLSAVVAAAIAIALSFLRP